MQGEARKKDIGRGVKRSLFITHRSMSELALRSNQMRRERCGQGALQKNPKTSFFDFF